MQQDDEELEIVTDPEPVVTKKKPRAITVDTDLTLQERLFGDTENAE